MVSRIGDAHRSTEHISCGEMMQMNNEEHLLITGNYHFPYSCCPDIVTWTTASLPAGCAKATEDEILAVFGILYALTRMSEGKRDLWSTDDGLLPALRFGERYFTTLRSY